MKKYTGKEFFVNTKQCETQKFPWGTLAWTIEPRTTGTDNMTGVLLPCSRDQDTVSIAMNAMRFCI